MPVAASSSYDQSIDPTEQWRAPHVNDFENASPASRSLTLKSRLLFPACRWPRPS